MNFDRCKMNKFGCGFFSIVMAFSEWWQNILTIMWPVYNSNVVFINKYEYGKSR